MKKINFQKKYYWMVFVTCLVIFHALSCKKFLDVQPRDYMFEEEAFSSKKGVESVLNGLYETLSDSTLYGKTLTLTGTEQMAQYYYAVSGEHRNLFKDYEFNDLKGLMAQVWSKAYRVILGTNNFCSQLENQSFKVIEGPERNIMLGEAYGIRAFIHFDMLRTFGPIYSTSNNKAAIPYVKTATNQAQPVLVASAVIDNILKDLEAAGRLLETDPVRTKGPNRITNSVAGESVDFLSNRHRRMNYYAVKTLQARVLLYAGKKEQAYETAQPVLSVMETFFPWQTEQQIAVDPMLSRETFFGIENRKLYDFYRQLFSPLLNDDKIYTPKEARLDGMFNPASTDLRLRYWFKLGLEGNKNYKVFIKHSNSTITDASIRYYQPLIKKSELYLIAAETAPDLQKGYFYLNSLRVSRGVPPITYQSGNTANDLIIAIRNEYQKEFIGEGQTFYMFKRLNVLSIANVSGTGKKDMDESKYVVPLPDDETYYR